MNTTEKLITDNSNPASSTEGAICFHCGEPVPPAPGIHVTLNNNEYPVCCYGCKAVVETIHGYGLADYYRYRSGLPAKPVSNEDIKNEFDVYNRPDIQETFVTTEKTSGSEATLLIEGMVCPACAWLIETRLAALDGIENISVNFTTHKAKVNWHKAEIQPGDILKNIYQLGYKAYPFNLSRQQEMLDKERKNYLFRIGLSGLLGIQVMMLAVALYAGRWSGIEYQYKTFLQWISLLLTTPVILYSAAPFYLNSWRSICNNKIDMDVPVATGISIAYLASAYATITGHGEIYFDSVVMLVFFLLSGRYLEFIARNKAARYLDNLARIVPSMAVKIDESDHKYTETVVPVSELQPGDQIQVKPGETIPVDGTIIKGNSTINEAVVSGEYMPVMHASGSAVIAGSINIDSPLIIAVNAIGKNTYLSKLCSLVEKAQLDKPAFTLLADKIAGKFLIIIIFLAVLTACYWWYKNPAVWVYATVSVLVITCPCALSLATPTALTTANSRLLRQGIALINNNALQALAGITHIAFDKTGTLTEGKLFIKDIKVFANISEHQLLSLARTLESGSEHPIAQAFVTSCKSCGIVQEQVNYSGAGVSGMIDQKRYYLGSLEFVKNKIDGIDEITGSSENADLYAVYLADEKQLLGGFTFGDKSRSGLFAMINTIRKYGIKPVIISGDYWPAVRQIAEDNQIEDFHARLSPESKLVLIENLQRNGSRVAMVGDGINDAPVMAKADVAIAIESGTDLSKVHADAILLDSRLADLAYLIQVAHETQRIVRQNTAWAILYNLLAVPAAMAGLIAPWFAAIGMSLSSVLVVTNSLRLGRKIPVENT